MKNGGDILSAVVVMLQLCQDQDIWKEGISPSAPNGSVSV